MIIRVIELARVGDITAAPIAGDDSARSTVSTTRCRYRVLPIVAVCLQGQAFLEIAKSATILARVGKGSALPDQKQGLHYLRWQVGQRDTRQGSGFTCMGRAKQTTEQRGQQQQPQKGHDFQHLQLAFANLDLRFDSLAQADVQFP